MDPRIFAFQNVVQDHSKRILELGPLNRPIADKKTYPNAFYCDVRSTEDVRKLYSGNDYLEATGIEVDPESIMKIDYVVQESYEKTFQNVEKFDCAIASHVLEHMGDLIFALRDISTVLNPGGLFYIVYPDKRYCFDHFRTSASFRDAYNVFRNGSSENASMVLDFYYSVVSENNPGLFWRNNGILNYLPKESFENAVEHYEKALNGVRMDDVHYWPFSDMDFLKFLYDCTRAKLIPFRCIAFWPCLQNDQQFIVVLQHDRSVMSHPERALRELEQKMEDALPDYFSLKDIAMQQENEKLKAIIGSQKEGLELQGKAVNILDSQIKALDNQIKEQEQTISDLKSRLDEYGEIIREQEYVIDRLKEA